MMKTVITGAASLAGLNNPDLQKSFTSSTTNFSSLPGTSSITSTQSSGSGSSFSASDLLAGALSGLKSGSSSLSSSTSSTGGSFGIGSANGANLNGGTSIDTSSSSISSGLSSGLSSYNSLFGTGAGSGLLSGYSTGNGLSNGYTTGNGIYSGYSTGGIGSGSSFGTFTSNNGYSVSKNALPTNSNYGILSGYPNYSSGAGTYNTLNSLNSYGSISGSLGGLPSGLSGYQTNVYSFPSTNSLTTGYTTSNSYNSIGPQIAPISNVNSFRVINDVSQSLITPSRSLDSIFIRFPQISEIDKLISTADTSGLLRTIQTIGSDSSVTCSQRITYLLQMQGRLRAAIEKKSFTADQLKVVINVSVTEITRLQNQIETNKKMITALGIADLKDKHDKQNAALQEAYKKSNNVDGQLPVLQARLKGFENQIQVLTRVSQGQRNKISNDKIKLVDIVNEIGSLQSKLKQLQDKEAALNTSTAKGTNKVTENDANIENLRIKVSQIQAKIKRVKDDADNSKTQTRDLDVKVERIRTDISVAQAKKQKFLNQIAALDEKINIQKTKAVDDNLIRMNDVITSLRNLIPNVQGAIDRNYYNCYGEGDNVKIEQSGNVSVYIISGDHFRDYLQNIYGVSPAMLPSLGRKDVVLNKVDIFGQDWAGRFGYPFNDSSFNSPDFAFSGSFSCLNPGSMMTGSSVITGVGANFIEAKDEQGNILRFNLGSCSRLQSTLKVPNVGQKFFWSGVPGNQGLNLYGGSCFE